LKPRSSDLDLPIASPTLEGLDREKGPLGVLYSLDDGDDRVLA